MYTVIISALIAISVWLVSQNTTIYKKRSFFFWLLISCLVGWIEFFTFLRYTPAAWIFDQTHVLGIKILSVEIEDLFFCPCFSVIFYWLYRKTKPLFYVRNKNASDKFIFTIVMGALALFYYDLGSQFSKYMALRMCLGFIGLIYCWNYSSFRHCLLFLLVVYAVGFGWDLPSVAYKIWQYVQDNGNMCQVYEGTTLKIFKAVFPIELPFYYLSGGFFSFWFLALVDKYCEESYNL